MPVAATFEWICRQLRGRGDGETLGFVQAGQELRSPGCLLEKCPVQRSVSSRDSASKCASANGVGASW